MKISLYVPKIEDLWFRKQLLSDEKTMFFNAGYEINSNFYDNNTGCFDFSEETWQEWYERKVLSQNSFYAYILDEEKFIGEVNFNLNGEKASIGIIIKYEFRGLGYSQPALLLLINEAKKRGARVLTDDIPTDRKIAIKVFEKLGFERIKSFYKNKFSKPEKIALLQKIL